MIQMLINHPAAQVRRTCPRSSAWSTARRRSPSRPCSTLMTLCPHVELLPAYGQTEMSPAGVGARAATTRRSRARRGHAALLRARRCSVSRSRSSTRTGKEVPRGTVGEIAARGPNMMRGYWNKPEQTKAALPGDGWLRTGDGAYMDERGLIFIVDRVKDMIVTGGENVFSAEVENALGSHPARGDVRGDRHSQRGMGRGGARGRRARRPAACRRRKIDRPLQAEDRRLQVPEERRVPRPRCRSPAPARSSRRSCASRTGRTRSAGSREALAKSMPLVIEHRQRLESDRRPANRRPPARVACHRSVRRSHWVEWLLRVSVKRRMPPDVDLAALRSHYQQVDGRRFSTPPEVQRTPVDAGGVPCEWVAVPASRPERVLLFIHGGGFACTCPTCTLGMRRACRDALEARVLLVDYRLVPEHPFPAAWTIASRRTDGCWTGRCRARRRDRRRFRRRQPEPGTLLAQRPRACRCRLCLRNLATVDLTMASPSLSPTSAAMPCFAWRP